MALSSGSANGDRWGGAVEIADGCGGHEVVSAGTGVGNGCAVVGNG